MRILLKIFVAENTFVHSVAKLKGVKSDFYFIITQKLSIQWLVYLRNQLQVFTVQNFSQCTKFFLFVHAIQTFQLLGTQKPVWFFNPLHLSLSRRNSINALISLIEHVLPVLVIQTSQVIVPQSDAILVYNLLGIKLSQLISQIFYFYIAGEILTLRVVYQFFRIVDVGQNFIPRDKIKVAIQVASTQNIGQRPGAFFGKDNTIF
ncbi:hypothetical protein BpHYR1_037224 [Brachionus plicatilis]|uniref:Uncharacterized protein n=1 Tax=Brachionus plicatilis TaxID=10195 RepID=A0A3M7PS81_BRAPC|nr:hypothetical protein BpHYR1_037224 [Brachionus plicatilis]